MDVAQKEGPSTPSLPPQLLKMTLHRAERLHTRCRLCPNVTTCGDIPYGEKTRPGRCLEPELIALRTLMINRARQRFCQWGSPASLIYVNICAD